MTGSDTIIMPKDVRRDPRTGEAATDPTKSRADDPTHGIDPGRARTQGRDTAEVEHASTRRIDTAAHGALQNGQRQRSGRAVGVFIGVVCILVVLTFAFWLAGGA